MTQITILAPDPAEPKWGTAWTIQADLLTPPLERAGLRVRYVPWTDEGADFSGDALVLPLLAWGYHNEPERWGAAIARIAGARLHNPAAMLRWNSDKTYLIALAAKGAPVVPTLFFEAIVPGDIERAEAHFGTTALIAKPPMSASADGILRLESGGDRAIAWGRPYLLQPMMPAIEAEGEYSLFFFGGRYSHAVLKTPRRGDFRVQTQHGGRETAAIPPASARIAADHVLATLDAVPLYARVDLVSDGAGAYLLMELELIEPQLFLDHATDGGDAFAEAVAAASGRDGQAFGIQHAISPFRSG